MTSRGNARQAIVRDDVDRQMLLKDLEDTVVRCGWEMFSFVFMPNHFHVFFRTPRPNLSRGMQGLLATYASRYDVGRDRLGKFFDILTDELAAAKPAA